MTTGMRIFFYAITLTACFAVGVLIDPPLVAGAAFVFVLVGVLR